MNGEGVWGIISFTFREAIRTKWLMVLGVVFFLLGINLPDIYLAISGNLAAGYLPSNLPDLLSVTFPFIPLLALPVGAGTIVEEREAGTLQYLLSNPVTKGEFFLGRSLGLLLATTAVIVIGFGAASIVVFTTGIASYFPIILILLFAAMLNAAMLGIALIISEFSKRKATALGLGIMVWFVLAVVSSLDTTINAISLKLGTTPALIVVLLDPIETARDLTVFGANLGSTEMTNAAQLIEYSWPNNYFEFTLISVLVWIIVTFVAGFLIFRRQDAA